MKRSILLDAHRDRGARLSSNPERPTVLAFASVPEEYAAALAGCALVDQTDRGLVRATGRDRQEFLHRLLANETRALTPGQGNRNLLLSGKGKVCFDVDLSVDTDEVRLSTPPGGAPGLYAALDMYHFTEAVQLVDASEEHAPLALIGPQREAIVAALVGALPPLDDHGWVRVPWSGSELRVSSLPVVGSPGLRLEAPPERVRELWDALVAGGAVPLGRVAADSLRCEAGQALPAVDVSDDVYPQEARLEAAFSLAKGCYVGQEVVAKIDTYAGLNKRLCTLRVAGDDPVAPGTRLLRVDDGEQRDLGVVTSWAYSFALDTGLVLAYVKRRHQREGTVFTLAEGGPQATIVRPPLRPGAVPVTGDFE